MTSVLPSPSIQLARSLQSIAVEELNAMSAFELFCTQLECGSTEAAVDAMKRLAVVAASMTVPDICESLLPYLTQLALKQPPHPDELLLILAQELSTVATQLGAGHVTDLLPMMERLAAVEETVVREQAVVVLNQLCASTYTPPGTGESSGTSGGDNDAEMTDAASSGDQPTTAESTGDTAAACDPTSWMGLIKRLSSADWFTAKVSCCGIVASVFTLITKNKNGLPAGQVQDLSIELLSIYKDLCQDDTPMVRRAAAKYLGQTCCVGGWGHKDFCAAVVPQLCRDEQDSVRLLAVAALAHVGTSFAEHPQWTSQYWLPIVKDGSTDLSWRVRHNLSKHFSDVAKNLGIDNDRRYTAEQSLVMACFVSLLTDNEAEVRAAAVAHVAQMIAWGGQQHYQAHLQPLLPALADDVVMEVRSKCALSLMDAAHDGKLDDVIILQSFGPLLESFLQDEFHEVQLQVLSNLHKIAHLLPGLPGVVAALLQMSKATNWRVREAVAQLLPHLAEARGVDFFATVLMEPAWLTLILDPVATVRSSIVTGMALLIRVTGEEWISSQLLPHHVRIYNSHQNSYLVRITLLRAHIETALETKSGQLFNDVILQILRGLADKVANVRMVAAEGLKRILPVAQDTAIIQSQIKPALEKRSHEDDDLDCQHECELALQVLK